MVYRFFLCSFLSLLVLSCDESTDKKRSKSKAAFKTDSFKKANSSNFSNTYGRGTIKDSSSNKYEEAKNKNANFSGNVKFDPTKNTRNRIKEGDKKEVKVSSSYSTNENKKRNYAAEAKKNSSFSRA